MKNKTPEHESALLKGEAADDNPFNQGTELGPHKFEVDYMSYRKAFFKDALGEGEESPKKTIEVVEQSSGEVAVGVTVNVEAPAEAKRLLNP